MDVGAGQSVLALTTQSEDQVALKVPFTLLGLSGSSPAESHGIAAGACRKPSRTSTQPPVTPHPVGA